MTSMSRAEQNYAARVDLAVAYRACVHYDLDMDISNHITQRAPAKNGDGDVMLVLPFGMMWEEATASKLIGIDFHTGAVVEGEGIIAPTANAIHRAIHNERYPIDGTTSVMHTHQKYTTALACVDDPEPLKIALSQTSMFLYGQIAYDYSDILHVTDEEEGKRLSKVLGNKNILMMGNHGVLTVGQRVHDAFALLYYTEKAAELQILAQSSGMKLRLAPLKTVKQVTDDADALEGWNMTLFEALKRILKDKKPCFMD